MAPKRDDDRLDRAGVAEVLGYKTPGTVSRYVDRGVFPEPDGHLGRSPWWYRRTVNEWNRTKRRRRGQPQKFPVPRKLTPKEINQKTAREITEQVDQIEAAVAVSTADV